MTLNGVPWPYMALKSVSWPSMVFHDPPWPSMVFHGTPRHEKANKFFFDFFKKTNKFKAIY
jgi:hypothetical protein